MALARGIHAPLGTCSSFGLIYLYDNASLVIEHIRLGILFFMILSDKHFCCGKSTEIVLHAKNF